jgi:putative redox protein
MTDPKPAMTVGLLWVSDLRFGATAGAHAFVIDGDSKAGPSPVQLLLVGLAGCMSMDVVDIVRKGRHQLTGFRTELAAERVADPPRRVSRVELRFLVHGAVPSHVVERAIGLSRDKFCSVWHSLRQDIELVTSFDITP